MRHDVSYILQWCLFTCSYVQRFEHCVEKRFIKMSLLLLLLLLTAAVTPDNLAHLLPYLEGIRCPSVLSDTCRSRGSWWRILVTQLQKWVLSLSPAGGCICRNSSCDSWSSWSCFCVEVAREVISSTSPWLSSGAWSWRLRDLRVWTVLWWTVGCCL